MIPDLTATRLALLLGARRSREACSLPADDSLPERVWRRHKWKIVGFGLFLLIDWVLLGGLGSKMVTHF
jgi:hypothetical protein